MINEDLTEDVFYALGEGYKSSKNKHERGYPKFEGVGDTVSMECDTQKNTVKFTVNDDEANEVVFDNVDFDKTYTLSIALWEENEAIKLVDYQETAYK